MTFGDSVLIGMLVCLALAAMALIWSWRRLDP